MKENAKILSEGIAPDPDIETGSVKYAQRFRGPAGRFILARQSEAAAALLAKFKGGECLDVGGGHGQLLNVYRSLDMTVTVAGSSEAAMAMIDGQPNIERRVCVLTDLPFPDKSFDVVVALRLLTHLTDWPAALLELCRVARRGVMVDYPPKASLNFLTPVMFHIKKVIEGDTRQYQVISQKDIRTALKEADYQIGAQRRQLLLPLGFHRLLRSPPWLQSLERFAGRVGLTNLVGGPALLLAIRSQEDSG